MPNHEYFGAAHSQQPSDVIKHRSGGTVGFYGTTPIVQQASAVIATLAVTSGTAGGFGFTTSAQFEAAVQQLQFIASVLRNLGVAVSA
jgi:hypothetical protein